MDSVTTPKTEPTKPSEPKKKPRLFSKQWWYDFGYSIFT